MQAWHLFWSRQDRYHVDIRFVFSDPVLARKSGIQSAVFNMTGHFLSPAQGAFDGIIIYFGEIASAVDINLPPGTLEQVYGCVLQASLGNPQF